MIRFLLKGILRDKQRSLLPVVIVIIGVLLTVFLYCWLRGVLNDSTELNANFNAGHVKIMTAAYAKNIDQTTFDLSVKNPDGGEEVIHRSPKKIMDDIAALDVESSKVLKKIRALI